MLRSFKIRRQGGQNVIPNNWQQTIVNEKVSKFIIHSLFQFNWNHFCTVPWFCITFFRHVSPLVHEFMVFFYSLGTDFLFEFFSIHFFFVRSQTVSFLFQFNWFYILGGIITCVFFVDWIYTLKGIIHIEKIFLLCFINIKNIKYKKK